MDLEALKKYCLSKKGVIADYPFNDETLVFKVGSKIFALTHIDSQSLTVNLKVNPLMSLELRKNYECIKLGYHMNKEYWNAITLDGTLEDEQVFALIDNSYNLVLTDLKRDGSQLLSK